jgi:hypothetical protein
VAGGQSAGRGIWAAVTAVAALAVVLAIVYVLVRGRDDGAPAADQPSATPSPTTTSAVPSPTTSSTSPSASASATTAAPPAAYAPALITLADVRGVPPQDTSAWDGAGGWKGATRPRATYACAPHIAGAAAASYEDTTYPEHRDGLDQESLRYADAASAHAALLALRHELGACASRSSLVDLFAGWQVSGLGDEAQLVDVQVPGQPATFAPGDSAVHLVEVWLVRRGPALSVLSFGHYDQDQPAPVTGFGTVVASGLCRAGGTSCAPRPVLRQTFGDPFPASG